MTEGRCWRLLAACSLILVASAFLPGQDAAADRLPRAAPDELLLRYALPVGHYPVARFPVPIDPAPLHPSPPYPSPPGGELFRQMVRSAGIIFSGRVTSIGRATSFSGPASASVTFQVEHAVRGTSAGEILTIQEWAGRWVGGERYRIGERVLLFLYAPSKLGLTSTVAGALGRFAVDSQGRIVMSPQHIANLVSEPFLRGKTVVPYADFALAVQRSTGEE